MKIGTDVAASEFYTAEKQHYDLDFKNQSSPDASKHLPVHVTCFRYFEILACKLFFSASQTHSCFTQGDEENRYTAGRLLQVVAGQVPLCFH